MTISPDHKAESDDVAFAASVQLARLDEVRRLILYYHYERGENLTAIAKRIGYSSRERVRQLLGSAHRTLSPRWNYGRESMSDLRAAFSEGLEPRLIFGNERWAKQACRRSVNRLRDNRKKLRRMAKTRRDTKPHTGLEDVYPCTKIGSVSLWPSKQYVAPRFDKKVIRPSNLLPQVQTALLRNGFKKYAVGQYLKTIRGRDFYVDTRLNTTSDRYFWISTIIK